MSKTGLVLEGGGMRGVFTAGVLDCFLDEGIDFDEVIGVSAGACHACSYVSKQRGRARDTNLNYLKDRRYCSLYSWLTTGDLFGAEFIYGTLPNELHPFDHETFSASDTKLTAVITDVETGEPLYYHLQDMKKDMQALRASASLPLAAKPVEINGRKYLDGGLSDSVPVVRLQQEGCDKTVVILTQVRGYRKEESKANKVIGFLCRKYPAINRNLLQRHLNYNKTMDYIDEEEKKGNLFVISPKEAMVVKRIEKDRDKLEILYHQGYQCAQSYLQEMKEFIKKENQE